MSENNIANEENSLIGINSSIVPASSFIYSLGTNAQRWKDVYIGPGSLSFYDNSVQTTAAVFYNGSFEDSTIQVSAGTTSATLVTMNTTTFSKGVSIDSGATNSKIIFANAGNYFLSLLGQFKFSGGASSYDVAIWYSRNNNIEANTAATFTLTSGQGSQTLAKFEDIVTVNAGDYIQFYWYTSVAPSSGPNGIYLYSVAAGTNPTRPASRSVRLNIFNVS